MITTVTSSVTSTVSSVTTMAGLSAGLAAVVILALIVILIQKETLIASDQSNGRTLSRALNVAVVPLVLAFGMIVAMNLLDVLGK